ncbi:TetR/AcrR family transcriptional regulator [Roseibium sp. MMSF_3412]|uniref:TetR/AcrR family transcriptional regulator n=1 Tax=Roseibium sp. MMSF_3412 TaxID=3046712 RepID=UPI00273E4F87|nr:TetR/AcrR family transcriptional regulator [Roseibium sp. MMSF_3412]
MQDQTNKLARADKSELRRQRIIEAAATLFILKGFHQTGMRDIAGQAGISLGNLYNHFKGKHEIIAAIAEMETAEMEPLLDLLETPGAKGRDVLIPFAKAYFRTCSLPENAALSAEIIAEIFRNPETGRAFSGTRKRLVTALEPHLPETFSNRAAAAGLVLDLIERAGQSAAGTSDRAHKDIETALLEMLMRTIEPV